MNKLKIEDDNMARKAIFVIISISFLQLSSTAIAQSIVEIKNHFSSTSVTAVQVLYTLPSIFIAISALLIPLLRRWISDKQITLLSLMLIILAGFLTLVAHNNIYLMYFYSMILGLGVGPIMPISSILATNQFEPQKRSKVLNFQMTAVSIGGIVICLASGVLILTGWFNYGYVFLLAIPALILCWKKWPEEKVVVQNEKTDAKSKGFNSATIFLSFVGFVFGICYFTFTANIALHFSNIGLENSFLVGIASSLLLCGGIIGSMAFIKVPDKYDFVLIIVGFISLGLGLIVFSHTSKWVFLITACLFGGLSNSVIISRTFNILAKEVHQSSRAFSFSIFTTCFQTGAFLSAIVINAIVNLFGANTVVERCSIAGVISLSLVVILVLNFIVRQLES